LVNDSARGERFIMFMLSYALLLKYYVIIAFLANGVCVLKRFTQWQMKKPVGFINPVYPFWFVDFLQ